MPKSACGWVVVQNEGDEAAGVSSAVPADDRQHSRTGDTDDEDQVMVESTAKKPMSPVRNVVSRAFKWYRSQSADNITDAETAPPKQAAEPKPKTSPTSKGMWRGSTGRETAHSRNCRPISTEYID